MFAPERRCAPATLPFSITATGTSPSFSSSSGSFSSNCMSLLAQARPAGPPPTIATPTSIRSSAGSVGAAMTLSESNGGGNSLGATGIALALLRLDRLGQLGDDFVEIAHHAEVRELEDRRVRILVDRKDVLRVLHPDLVLDRPGDAGGEVQLRCHRLPGLADLGRVGVPAGIDHGAGRGDRPAHRLGQLLAE